MSIVTYQHNSPYYNTPQTTSYLGYWVPPAVSRSATDTLIEIEPRHNNRPDILSYDLYGTSRLWWIFAMMNPDQLVDPIYDLVSGMQIYVPSNITIQGYL